MKLISKKKLLETIEPMVGKFDDDGEFWWSRESILRAINNAPTVEERKVGKWIKRDKWLYCSACDGGGWGLGAVTFEWQYCPLCGAKIGE